MDIVALGELLVDFTLNGISNQGNEMYEANPGGAPCNVLSMLQNLGKKTAFIGKVGKDSFGEMLQDVVKKQGINTEGLVFDETVPTTLAFVHTKPDGDRSFSFYRKPGADMMLRKEDVCEKLIRQTKIFHFGTLSMTEKQVEEATKYAVSLAKESGAIISFDPNLRQPLWDSMEKAKEKISYGLSNCDVLKISDNEIEFMTGESDIDAGIHKIKEQYHIPFICATMGKDGSKAYYDGETVVGKPFHSDKTIETTGAGDTFCACMLNFILENGIKDFTQKDVAEMLNFANAAACLITTKKGALRVMPKISEIEEFISSSM